MAHTPYTGKSVGALATFKATAIPGWRKITIEEQAEPLPEQLDKTNAASSAYERMEDPMGGKGWHRTVITVEGLASRSMIHDVDIFSLALDNAASTGNVVVQKAAGVDKFTLTNAVLKRRSLPADALAIVPYTLVFELEDAGTWAAA